MSKRPSLTTIILLAVLAILTVVAVVFVNLYLEAQKRADDLTGDVQDELMRTRYFITDWYDELSRTYRYPQVYLNELRFDGGQYTLTTAKNRIRAVYPRGERFFVTQNVTTVEFFQIDGKLRCRLGYGQSGEYMFVLN